MGQRQPPFNRLLNLQHNLIKRKMSKAKCQFFLKNEFCLKETVCSKSCYCFYFLFSYIKINQQSENISENIIFIPPMYLACDRDKKLGLSCFRKEVREEVKEGERQGERQGESIKMFCVRDPKNLKLII